MRSAKLDRADTTDLGTHDRLVKSAQELLWERGYVGMSSRAIQDRSQAGQGSMYHHFRSREALAAAALAKSAFEFRKGIEDLLQSSGSPLQIVENYLRRSRQALRGCPLGKLTQDPDITSSDMLREPIRETFAWLQEELARLLNQAVSAGELPADLNTVQTSATLIAVIQGGYVLAAAMRSQSAFQLAMDGAIALLRQVSDVAKSA